MNYLGRHILIDLYDCNKDLLDNKEYIENVMLKAAEIGNATIVNSSFHKFSPYGVSGIVVISESHLSIHTWVEFNYAAIDVFTCSDKMFTDKIVNFLIERFYSENHIIKELKRGTEISE